MKLQDIFIFEQKGINEEGRIYGAFTSTGLKSKFTEHLRSYGIELSPEIFNFVMDV
ncbi:MAG: hypothetical protein J7K30_03580 [Deltaproteobacteria bacterium]|nr:hypothetical protein [Deltaproteobacteria bacterium]